jgi:hypothetical protein
LIFSDDFDNNDNKWTANQFSIKDGFLYLNDGRLTSDKFENATTFIPSNVVYEIKLKSFLNSDEIQKAFAGRAMSVSYTRALTIGGLNISGMHCKDANVSGLNYLNIWYEGKSKLYEIKSFDNVTFWAGANLQLVVSSLSASLYNNGKLLADFKLPNDYNGRPVFELNKISWVLPVIDHIRIYANYSNPDDFKKEFSEYEHSLYQKAKLGNIIDCDSYFKKFPNGSYTNEVIVFKQEKEELIQFNTAKNGFLSECDSYLNKYPSGKFKSEVLKLKEERSLYSKALSGDLSEYNAYLQKYPNGVYVSEVDALKKKRLAEIERNKQIQTNSNKLIWKVGNKLCYDSPVGIVAGTINSWNEDKSMVQLKIISNVKGSRIEGQDVSLGEVVWVDADKKWHICLQDEIKVIDSQNDDPYKNWLVGKRVCMNTSKGAWIFRTSVTLKGEIIQWNPDKSKVRIRIISGSDGATYNGETLYNDKFIWDEPTGWFLCQ